jgi:nucleoside-diphosphate kinase
MKKNILRPKKKLSKLSKADNDILEKIEESIKELSDRSKPILEFSKKVQKVLTAKKPERTLTIIKPDAVEKSLTGEIIERLEKQNIKPIAMKMRKLSKVEAGLFYFHLLGKVPDKVFASIIDYMTSSKVVFVVWQGKGVVKKVRTLCGPTDPQKAIKSQLRALSDDDMGKEFQAGRAVKNIIHSSANSADAAREINFFFRPWEY